MKRFIFLLMVILFMGCNQINYPKPKERILMYIQSTNIFGIGYGSHWIEAVVLEKSGDMWKIKFKNNQIIWFDTTNSPHNWKKIIINKGGKK